MSRIRTIKPDFFKHEALFDAEQDTGLPLRIAFAGLWTVCDREGRFMWRPRALKTDVMPYDLVDFNAVLEALCERGFIIKYVHGDVMFGAVPSWNKHQSINQREAQSTIPAPSESVRTEMPTEAHVQAYEYNGVNIAPALRETIFARDGNQCVRCKSVSDLTVDHIFPRSIGGTHAPTNLRTLCRSCNSRRPVSGQPLLDDLALDGFTMNDMQRMCMHVQSHGEGKGREGEGKGSSETNVSGADASPVEIVPVDARTALFRDGVSAVRAMTGKGDGPVRSIVGKWLKDATDDCQVVLEIIHAAADMRPSDPVGWITKSLQTRKPKIDPSLLDKNGNAPGDPYYGVDY